MCESMAQLHHENLTSLNVDLQILPLRAFLGQAKRLLSQAIAHSPRSPPIVVCIGNEAADAAAGEVAAAKVDAEKARESAAADRLLFEKQAAQFKEKADKSAADSAKAIEEVDAESDGPST